MPNRRRISGIHARPPGGGGGDGVATAPPPRRPEPAGAPGRSEREAADPDEAAADRAADERRSIEEALDLSGAGEDVTQRQLDRVTILRLREDLRRNEARLRRVQRDNDRLRANDYRTQHEAREEGRRELRPEVDRLRALVKDLKADKRQLEDDKRYRELEQTFEERFGQADTSVGRELLEWAKTNGSDVLPQLLKQILAQMNRGGGEGRELPSPGELAAALQNAPEAVGNPEPRENPRPPVPQQPAPPTQPSPPPAYDEGDPPEGSLDDPASLFVQAVTERALITLDEELASDAFAAEVRSILAGLEDSSGWTPTAEAFVRLTERLIPPVAQRSAAPAAVADLLAPFAGDLPPVALRVIENMPPALLKKTMIDPQGVDYQGEEDYLLDVLDALQARL